MEEQKERKAESEPVPKPRGKHRKGLIAGIIVAVIVVAGIGVWNWHNTPGFCGTVCHTSMASYVESYEGTPGQAGKDKYGNEVSDAGAMLAVSHAQEGKGCLDCHEPSVPQQLGEVQETITGNYELPLKEVNTTELMENAGHGSDGDAFCLKSGCHTTSDGTAINTRADLTKATEDLEFNPHSWRHGAQNCSECHKSHRASVMMCTECHTDAYKVMPAGWVDAATGKQIEESAVE